MRETLLPGMFQRAEAQKMSLMQPKIRYENACKQMAQKMAAFIKAVYSPK